MLNTIITGAQTELPPLLIAHGLFGSARNWGVIAKRLSENRQVITVDMRNHGFSPWYESQSYNDMADDLMAVLRGFDGPADVLGHSMGGKTAMVLALRYADLVNRLIIADIAPVTYDHDQSSLIKAMRDMSLSQVEKRSDADSLLKADIPDAGVRAFLLQSLDVQNREWRLNLDVLDKEMDKILSFPKISSVFTKSTLFLSGALSDYVKTDHREIIKPLFPKAKFAKIPNVGHWLHAEKPREFEAAVHAFLA
ncbi:alpha/beta fold hydrolase [Parasulfitobacter algicola]|uniref:Alpha/beta fold hydrolase n=1 Tax=Parasulfitobacter algicola TaxID=2614809 RepID=A0ABX2ISY3_9RHOB|nr:alpha/beta fold hydrolase [Sulfitobacter algicola]NSX56024.1 alpha/beta fold hydrolase [Sulfitobacter algicola]